jgi:spore coat protein U-like protein
MRKTVFLLASLFVMTLATQQVKAQTGASASASAEAKATVVTVISITKTSDLNFGSFAPSATDGTVSVELTGTRSVTGGITLLDQEGKRALFTVNGTPNASYYVKLPTEDGNTIPLTRPQGADPLIITSLVHNAVDNPALDDEGKKMFSVGGTLSVKANQPAGEYTGTFDVIVAY